LYTLTKTFKQRARSTLHRGQRSSRLSATCRLMTFY